jgi:CubicO group peptidase (beta-lactamase class C family)
VYFGVRSYRELASIGTVKTLIGVGSVVLAAAIVATVLWSNRDLVRRAMWQLTLNRVADRIEDLESLDGRIQFLMDEGDLASATVGIVVNDALVWAEAYGEAELDTVYNTASVTKPFVATAILQLYERGLIDLDDDVNEVLPFSLRHPEYPDTPITVRMLLTHQSGLAHFSGLYAGYHMDEETAEWMSENRGWHLPRPDPIPPFAEFIEGYVTPGGPYYTPDAWIAAKPGTEYSYSTPGYDTLAYLVECVTGQPFAEYARDNIFDPLGMADTGFSVTDFSGQVALPYERVYGVLSKANAELPLSDVRTIGGGGMLSTVPDMAQFAIAHLNQGRVGRFQLLQPETVALMHEEAVSFPLGHADLNQVSYGLGLGHIRDEPWSAWGHLYDMHGATGHGGSWWGYQGQMWFVERGEGGYGIILLINTESDFKAEARGLWLFASPLKLQVLLMEEAALMYQQETSE